MRVVQTLESLLIVKKKILQWSFRTPMLAKDLSQGAGKELTGGCSCSSTLLVTICKVQSQQTHYQIRGRQTNRTETILQPESGLFFLWCHATNCLSSLLSPPEGAAGLARGCRGAGRRGRALQEQTRSGIWFLPSQAAWFLAPPASERSEEPKKARFTERRLREKCKRRRFAASSVRSQ